jgi:hypothetical protein
MPTSLDRGKVRNNYLVAPEVIDDVRAALRRGLATEKAITKYCDIHWVEFWAAIKILEHNKEIVRKSPVTRYQGIVASTLSYRKRKKYQILDQWRSTRGRPKRSMTGGSLRYSWELMIRGIPVNWFGLRYFRMNHPKRRDQRYARLEARRKREAATKETQQTQE